ncbi:hypothetical protein J3A83DRAFT_4367612 [Scleroderma citrinum]
MAMANVSTIQASVVPQVQRSSGEPEEKDAQHLALRLLNKRARVRLSPEPVNLSSFPGKLSLFSVANEKGWFAAVAPDVSRGSALILSPLSALRSAFELAAGEDDPPLQPQRRVLLNGVAPVLVTFASNESRLLIGLSDGSILVYATDQLFSSGDEPLAPVHTFPAFPSATLLSIHPNPEGIPALVAVLRDCGGSPGSLAVELLDVQKLSSLGGWIAGNSPNTTPTAISWSPKGKQLALGMQGGDIVTYSPTQTSTPKSSIPHPPSANGMSVISTQWLSASSFHAIYAPPGQLAPDTEQLHFHVSLDSKSNSAQDIKFNSPYLPFPGLRPPGSFAVTLKNWDPYKTLLFLGDSTSSDIGVIGAVTDGTGEDWHNLSLEETSMPSLPLDKDQNDTVMIGLDLDLTNTESYRHTTASGEPLDLPSPPIMYAYASDGTVVGWYLLNTSGNVYHGMIKESSMSLGLVVPSSISRETSSDMNMTPSVSPSAPTDEGTPFGQTTTTATQPTASAPPQSSVFGTQTSPFEDSTASQATSPFIKPAAFGQSSFGQPSATPFGQGLSAPSSGGFGAFASTTPAKFGQSAFGFSVGVTGQPEAAQSTAAQPATPVQPPESTQEDSMAEDGPTLDGLRLGSSNTQDADSKPSIFGNTTSQTTSAFQSTGGGLIKSGTAFGALGNLDQKSPFANPTAFTAATTLAFGTGAFGSQPVQSSAFGQPSFGQGQQPAFGQGAFSQPAFGQPAFGQPAFGQASFGQTQQPSSMFGKSPFGMPSLAASAAPTATSSGGGFSAFASSGTGTFTAFTNKDTLPAKPAWAVPEPTKPTQDQPKSVFSAPTSTTSVFSKPPESPTPKAAPAFTGKGPEKAVVSPFAVRETTVQGLESRSPSPSTATPTTKAAESKAAAGGTFGSLQSTPSAFKPATGFFGEMPTDSPFFTPKQTDTKPVSAFALSTTPVALATTPSKSSTAAPTFGSSSMPGTTPKSIFGPATSSPTTAPTTTTPAAAPATGAFSAFASSGGFGSFASSGAKSFTDLLRDGGEASKDPSKIKTSVFGADLATTPVVAASTTALSTPTKAPETPETLEVTKVPGESEPGFSKGKAPEPPQIKEPSFETISSSTSSSFVDVSAEEGEVGEDTVPAEGESEDETRSFLSDVPSESEESERDTEEADGTSEVDEQETNPADIPLPSTPPVITRSPSTTPKAELPKISVSTSPSPSPPQVPSPSANVSRISPVRELSTTPPSSPDREGDRPSLSAPVSKPSPPANSPFSLTPRINNINRPVRSSPLASTPLVGDVEPRFSITPPPQSKSAPPTIPTPAVAPKAPIDTRNLLTKKEELTTLSRPATPPLLSNLAPKPGIGASSFAATVPTAPAAPAPTLAPFSFSATLPTFTLGSPVSGLFGMSTELGDITPPPSKPSTPAPFTLPPSLFTAPAPPVATTPPPPATMPSFTSPMTFPAPAPVPPKPEQGMQAECANLLSALTKELENLRTLAANASRQTAEVRKKTPGATHTKVDLADSLKWLFGDMKEYGRVMLTLQEDFRELKQQRVTLRKALRELDSNMLKALTKKEEIVRFNKARTDAEFAKMLKVRTLGPEYLEIQSQLRRDIRAVRDRVQKLEDNLQASKRRLQEFKTGKPSFRPPSLDTINRTLRNIDIAIGQQRHDVQSLRSRISNLDISSDGVVLHSKRLMGPHAKRPLNVTPNVAATTAAALNAERSAQKLKRALLATRNEPLLNTKAVSASVPTSFQTPQKSTTSRSDSQTPAGIFSLPATPMMSFPSAFTTWSPTSPSDFGDSPSASISPARHRGGTKHHQKPIALKKTAAPGTVAPVTAPSFEWGPVQSSTPMTTLPFSLRCKADK